MGSFSMNRLNQTVIPEHNLSRNRPCSFDNDTIKAVPFDLDRFLQKLYQSFFSEYRQRILPLPTGIELAALQVNATSGLLASYRSGF